MKETNSNNILVSICIPTYNGGAYLSETLDSAIKQTYTHLEIVVSDDASRDNTLEIVSSYKDKTKIPIFIYHHKSNGIGANWNNCIKKAKGAYIKFLFQDDILLPTCIEKMVKLIEHDSRIGLVACKRDFIIEKNVNIAETNKWINEYDDLQKGIPCSSINNGIVLDKTLFKSDAFFRRPLNKIGEPSTYFFKKQLISKIGFFSEDLKQILDYEFCYRVLKKYKIAILDEKLCQFRLHRSQATQINKGNDSKDYEIYYKLFNRDYFWYLNNKKKVSILRSRFLIIDYFFRFKGKLKL
jgi:glycosyltransferase involved in cell wall biosynthesis